jgi:hypothetical protein
VSALNYTAAMENLAFDVHNLGPGLAGQGLRRRYAGGPGDSISTLIRDVGGGHWKVGYRRWGSPAWGQGHVTVLVGINVTYSAAPVDSRPIPIHITRAYDMLFFHALSPTFLYLESGGEDQTGGDNAR